MIASVFCVFGGRFAKRPYFHKQLVHSFTCLLYLLLFYQQRGDGGEERGDGNPDGGRGKGVAHGYRLALALVVGRHVDEVILLQVIGGRKQKALHVGEVHVVHLIYAVHLPAHHHVLAAAVDGEVARAGYGVENGEVVFGHVDAPRLVHLAEHVDADVEIFHRHYGIFHEVTRHEAFLYVLRHFLTGLAGHREPAEYWKVNRALTVHGVGDGLVAAVTAARGGDGRNGRAERLRHVAPRGQRELLLEHGVLAVYHNVDFVFRA